MIPWMVNNRTPIPFRFVSLQRRLCRPWVPFSSALLRLDVFIFSFIRCQLNDGWWQILITSAFTWQPSELDYKRSSSLRTFLIQSLWNNWFSRFLPSVPGGSLAQTAIGDNSETARVNKKYTCQRGNRYFHVQLNCLFFFLSSDSGRNRKLLFLFFFMTQPRRTTAARENESRWNEGNQKRLSSRGRQLFQFFCL